MLFVARKKSWLIKNHEARIDIVDRVLDCQNQHSRRNSLYMLIHGIGKESQENSHAVVYHRKGYGQGNVTSRY